MAFSLPISLAALSVAAYAVWRLRSAERRIDADIARTNRALSVLDDELTATNRVLDDRAQDTRKIVAALKGLDARTVWHHTWLQGLSAHARLNVYRPETTSEPIDAADVIAAAERIVKGDW